MSPHANTRHGHCTSIHRSSTYNIWAGMLQRCQNPNSRYFRDYGGRGITVCERWRSFASFLSDMGERPSGLTIQRIDNDGDYESNNCKWATYGEQASNRRSNRLIEWRGSVYTLKELAEVSGINRKTLSCRIERGWSIEQSVAIPPVEAGKYAFRNR